MKMFPRLAFLSDWQQEAAQRGFHNESFAEVSGLPILSSSKGDPAKPTVYLSAGIHGDEPAGPLALLALLKEGFFDDRFHWLICPLLNPTGMIAGTRENEQGIDLNRDYCLRQTAEICAHIQWLGRQEIPQFFLSLHEDWESTGFYFYEINLGSEAADAASPHHILEAVAPFFDPEPEGVIDGHEVTTPGWIYHSENPDFPEAWPEAIFLAKLGCPLSHTFETPSSATLAMRVSCHQAAVKEAVKSRLL